MLRAAARGLMCDDNALQSLQKLIGRIGSVVYADWPYLKDAKLMSVETSERVYHSPK